MKSDSKTALKVFGGITIALLLAIAIFAFIFGGVIVSLPDDIEMEETSDSSDSTSGDIAGTIVGTVASTMILVLIGALLLIIGIIIIIVLAIFVGCFVCDMKNKPKRGYAIFIAVVSIILSIIAIIISVVASPIYLVMLIATLCASIYGILSAKRAKAIKAGLMADAAVPASEEIEIEPDELDAPANDKE